VARVTTHGDHRIAMAFAVAALAGVASAIELDDPECVAVSYPSFWADVSEATR
jgi:3-phosphoshikimate 1-carboxyvinyltransferase